MLPRSMAPKSAQTVSRNIPLTRTYLPRARQLPIASPSWRSRRTFFGLGQLAGVLANPAETLRQLNESREMLQKAKEDIELANEAKRIPKKHTFAKLPGFHGRVEEQSLLRKILAHTPKMTVMFGATSVGKTALLRQVLATDDYYVVKFDLRISGFADLRTLYLALCEQFQQFFEDMHEDEMGKQALAFKHMVIDLSNKEKQEGGYQVTVADLASLMESLQSSLLKYWEFDPKAAHDAEAQKTKAKDEEKSKNKPAARKIQSDADDASAQMDAVTQSDYQPFKKRPIVFLLDEAHKLPALIDSQLSLKVFLDTLLVLTKQDRLCHVLLCTSDPFFQHFLRMMNVGHHAQILTIGDCGREEALSYFHNELLPEVPPELATKLVTTFDEIWDAFGGKLSHINDYVSAWTNSGGTLTPFKSPIFIQAYTLLQFHLTHRDFETYSPLSTATSGLDTSDDAARFCATDLLHVMRKLTKPPYSIPYFTLCREIGTAQVDSMVKTRILELRWTQTATPEEGWVERKWSEDGIERPVVLPMTRIVRKAMEVVLKEEDVLEQERQLREENDAYGRSMAHESLT